VCCFRGIKSLRWSPSSPFSCVIGAGDSRKSTILDAIEAVLSTRWIRFSESDYLNCDTQQSIEIRVTVGELSSTLISDERFGFHIRGWTSSGEIRDEPAEDDEPVLTVQLVVDATQEPVWTLVCDRSIEARILSNRDRLKFGCIRLSGGDAKQLSWGQGSILSRLTGDTEDAATQLAAAYRVARDSSNLQKIPSLASAATFAEKHAREMGAYINRGYAPGLELGNSGASTSAIGLYDGHAPLKLAGSGTRRLVTLAMQKSLIIDGAIIIIDEVELGLEPHRILGAISQLKGDQNYALSKESPIGQIILTTHSDIALAECGAETVHVCRLTSPTSCLIELYRTQNVDLINALLRHTPRALFSTRILVTEGMTEVGLFLGLRQYWTDRHENIPIEHKGVSIADGNGSQAVEMSVALSSLGFPVALFRDSDVALKVEEQTKLIECKIKVIEYDDPISTEQAIYLAASDDHIQSIIDHARNEFDEESINDAIIAKLDHLDRHTVRSHFREWIESTSLDARQIRLVLSEIAIRKKWMKDGRLSRELAFIVFSIAEESTDSALSKALSEVEQWLYG